MNYSNKYDFEHVISRVSYDPDTGDFFNKKGEKLKIKTDHRGYGRIYISPKLLCVLTHRVAWLIQTGSLPEAHIDHVDGDKLNNKFNNLRICSHNNNQHNQSKRKNNKSGFKGVCWMKRTKKWHAQICCNSKITHLGLFTDKIEAAKAYDKAAMELHGDFAYTNFPKENYI